MKLNIDWNDVTSCVVSSAVSIPAEHQKRLVQFLEYKEWGSAPSAFSPASVRSRVSLWTHESPLGRDVPTPAGRISLEWFCFCCWSVCKRGRGHRVGNEQLTRPSWLSSCSSSLRRWRGRRTSRLFNFGFSGFISEKKVNKIFLPVVSVCSVTPHSFNGAVMKKN